MVEDIIEEERIGSQQVLSALEEEAVGLAEEVVASVALVVAVDSMVVELAEAGKSPQKNLNHSFIC